MRFQTSLSLALAALFVAVLPAAHAVSGNDQVALAAAGRYDELRTGLEQDAARGKLSTADQHALCFAYSKTKRYDRLFTCLDKLQASIAAGDKRTRLFGLEDATAVPRLLRAEAFLELGNYAGAAAEAQAALDWFKAEDSEDTDIQLEALALLSMSATLQGKREEGQQHAQALAKVGTFTLFGSGYVSTKAMALARSHMALGNHQQVLDAIASDRLFTVHAFLDKLVTASFITGTNNWAWQELPRAFMVNRALRGVGRLGEAKAGFDRLLQLPQIRDNGEIHWLTLYERGLIAESEKNHLEAIEFFRRAIEVIEQQRASINTEASKIGFVGDKQQVYERIVDNLYAAGRTDQAFEYVERSQARALVDLLASRDATTLVPAGDRAAPLLREVEQAEAEALSQGSSAGPAKAAQRKIASDAVGKVRQASPELGSLISVSSASIGEVRAALAADEALVQYYYRGKTLYAMVLDRKQLKMVPLRSEGMDDEIRRFRALMQEADDKALPFTTSLYDRLVRPLEPQLQGNRRLLIVPHGILHYLPFAALNDGKAYLLEKFAVRELPSAGVSRFLQSAAARPDREMLLLGNPDLGNPKLDLPSAQVEVGEIAQGWKTAKVLVRGEATETFFKRNAARFPMLHIAAHGIFNQKAPLDSAVMLARDAENDGKLTVAELYGLRINADLVTLSACETGLGQINNGDDVVGLTRGFLYAGARSIVASLWEVDDEATSVLMRAFYAAYPRGSKVEALRQAQLEVRKRFPHPYFWSAFYLTGSAG